jgi:DNA polymerase (family X)
MENREAARSMFALASLLESQGANPYRVRAYRRAAVNLLRLGEQATALAGEDGQLRVAWLGERLRRKVGELVTRGQMRFHQDVLAELPGPLRGLMAVPGIGPKTAARLVDELGIKSPRGVASAARQGRLRRLRGIGGAREAALGAAAQQVLDERRASRQSRQSRQARGAHGAHAEQAAHEERAALPAAA